MNFLHFRRLLGLDDGNEDFIITTKIRAPNHLRTFHNQRLNVGRTYFLSLRFVRFVISVMSYKNINSQNQSINVSTNRIPPHDLFGIPGHK